MKDIKEFKGLEIFLGYNCNIKCSFCYQKDLRLKYKNNIEEKKVLFLIKEGYKKGRKFIIFSGGEPTLDNNLGKYIEYSKMLGFEHIRVHTNGFKFKDYNYLENLYSRGLTGVTISIHGYKGIHDRIVRKKGSFNIILRALINFEKLKKINNNFVFDINTVICRDNIKTLLILFKFLFIFSISRKMLVYPYSIDLGKEKLLRILPKKNYLKNINSILELVNEKQKGDFVLETIPYCLINTKYWDYIEKNYKTDKKTYLIEGEYIDDFQYIDGKIKFDECKKCFKNTICYGFSKDYYILYGKPNFNIL